MTKVVEAKVRQASTAPEPVHTNLKPLEVTGKGDVVSLRCRCAVSSSAAFVDKGTSLELPFLVSGRKAIRLSRSTCSQRSPSISPRLIPVSMAKTMTGQMCGFLVCLAASSSRSNSPFSNRRLRAGEEEGIFTLLTGLDDSIKPHSFIAILRQCLIRMRS